jgi:hypothetical protein
VENWVKDRRGMEVEFLTIRFSKVVPGSCMSCAPTTAQNPFPELLPSASKSPQDQPDSTLPEFPPSATKPARTARLRKAYL